MCHWCLACLGLPPDSRDRSYVRGSLHAVLTLPLGPPAHQAWELLGQSGGCLRQSSAWHIPGPRLPAEDETELDTFGMGKSHWDPVDAARSILQNTKCLTGANKPKCTRCILANKDSITCSSTSASRICLHFGEHLDDIVTVTTCIRAAHTSTRARHMQCFELRYLCIRESCAVTLSDVIRHQRHNSGAPSESATGQRCCSLFIGDACNFCGVRSRISIMRKEVEQQPV